jgi:hypothetical protein
MRTTCTWHFFTLVGSFFFHPGSSRPIWMRIYHNSASPIELTDERGGGRIHITRRKESRVFYKPIQTLFQTRSFYYWVCLQSARVDSSANHWPQYVAYKQCWGSGSASFRASRNRIHKSEVLIRITTRLRILFSLRCWADWNNACKIKFLLEIKFLRLKIMCIFKATDERSWIRIL